MSKVRELLKKLYDKGMGCTHRNSTYTEDSILEAQSALLEAVLEALPEEKKCHKHDTPKAGTVMLSPCEKCDYNYVYNESLSEVKQRLTELMGGE